MNSRMKGFLCVIRGLGLTMLFGFVLEVIINHEFYNIIFLLGLCCLFSSTYLENEMK